MDAVHALTAKLLDHEHINAVLVLIVVDDMTPIVSIDVNAHNIQTRAARILNLAKQCGSSVATLIDTAVATGRVKPNGQ